MIRLGTSGYSYEDWIGEFYPDGIAKTEMLPFYAQHLHATEINYTYYRMPSARTLAAMAKKVPDDFVFTVKATKEMTHDREGDGTVFQQFNTALQPLVDARNLGYCCVDEPQMKGLIPPIAVATAPISYVRFHGRNYQKWWAHEEAFERYSYSYPDAELEEWVPKIATLNAETTTTYV